jgi:hypothetical protein
MTAPRVTGVCACGLLVFAPCRGCACGERLVRVADADAVRVQLTPVHAFAALLAVVAALVWAVTS